LRPISGEELWQSEEREARDYSLNNWERGWYRSVKRARCRRWRSMAVGIYKAARSRGNNQHNLQTVRSFPTSFSHVSVHLKFVKLYLYQHWIPLWVSSAIESLREHTHQWIGDHVLHCNFVNFFYFFYFWIYWS